MHSIYFKRIFSLFGEYFFLLMGHWADIKKLIANGFHTLQGFSFSFVPHFFDFFPWSFLAVFWRASIFIYLIFFLYFLNWLKTWIKFNCIYYTSNFASIAVNISNFHKKLILKRAIISFEMIMTAKLFKSSKKPSTFVFCCFFVWVKCRLFKFFFALISSYYHRLNWNLHFMVAFNVIVTIKTDKNVYRPKLQAKYFLFV